MLLYDIQRQYELTLYLRERLGLPTGFIGGRWMPAISPMSSIYVGKKPMVLTSLWDSQSDILTEIIRRLK